MIKILLVYHSYWWQKHSCFAWVRLYLFSLNTKKTAWESIDVVNWWFSAILKPKFCCSPAWKRDYLRTLSTLQLIWKDILEALTYPVQCKVIISTYTDGIKKEAPPCLKCTVLIRPKSQQSPVSVVVFWGVITHNIHKYNNTCNILSCTQNPLAQTPT